MIGPSPGFNLVSKNCWLNSDLLVVEISMAYNILCDEHQIKSYSIKFSNLLLLEKKKFCEKSKNKKRLLLDFSIKIWKLFVPILIVVLYFELFERKHAWLAIPYLPIFCLPKKVNLKLVKLQVLFTALTLGALRSPLF
jgi:hypothetical protein